VVAEELLLWWLKERGKLLLWWPVGMLQHMLTRPSVSCPLLRAAAADPNTTHIVYPFGPKGDPDDGKEYMRVLEFK